MALSFNGIEPVEFGGKECTPKINTELKMRLNQIKKYDEADDAILASAFPNDEKYVKEFLNEKMTLFDKQILHSYLMGGEKMVETLISKLERTIDNG